MAFANIWYPKNVFRSRFLFLAFERSVGFFAGEKGGHLQPFEPCHRNLPAGLRGEFTTAARLGWMSSFFGMFFDDVFDVSQDVFDDVFWI